MRLILQERLISGILKHKTPFTACAAYRKCGFIFERYVLTRALTVMCMYVVYICMHIYVIHICMHIYVVYVCMYIYVVYLCMYVCAYIVALMYNVYVPQPWL